MWIKTFPRPQLERFVGNRRDRPILSPLTSASTQLTRPSKQKQTMRENKYWAMVSTTMKKSYQIFKKNHLAYSLLPWNFILQPMRKMSPKILTILLSICEKWNLKRFLCSFMLQKGLLRFLTRWRSYFPHRLCVNSTVSFHQVCVNSTVSLEKIVPAIGHQLCVNSTTYPFSK